MNHINKIYNINCIDFLKNIENNYFDHVLTSPPYNRKRNDKYEHYDDNIDNYFEFLVNCVDELIRTTKGYVIFNIMKNYYNKKDVFKLIGHYSDKIQDIVIWEKTNPLPASGYSITNAYEFFIIFGDKSVKSNTTYTKNIISSSINTNTSKIHKAIMKQSVCDWFIQKFTQPNDLIFDPFMGSGTTAKSCIENDRLYCGTEISKIYFDDCMEKISIKVSSN